MNTNPEESGGAANQIEALEQREAQATLAGDIPALQELWADDLLVNSTANLIAGKQVLLEMIEKGMLRLRSFERRTVRVTLVGDIVVATGNEVSQLIGPKNDFKSFVSYMNVWIRRAGNWQLVGRHLGQIDRVRVE